MILTCPQCATGYFVRDADLALGGDEASCAACGTRWTLPIDGSQAVAEAGSGGEPAGLAATTADNLSRTFRARASGRRRLRQATLAGVGWGGAAAGLALIVGLAVVFRVEVARVAPPAAAVFAAAGLPVNRVGLVIEAVHAEPGLQDGHATLGVTGLLRNVEDRAVRAPPLRVELYNAHGRPVAGQFAGPAGTDIPAGETRRFAVAIFDPPLSAYNLQVAFAPEATGHIPMARTLKSPTAPPASAPGLRGALTPDAPPSPVLAETDAPHG